MLEIRYALGRDQRENPSPEHLWFFRVLSNEKNLRHWSHDHLHSRPCLVTSWRMRSCCREKTSEHPIVQRKYCRLLVSWVRICVLWVCRLTNRRSHPGCRQGTRRHRAFWTLDDDDSGDGDECADDSSVSGTISSGGEDALGESCEEWVIGVGRLGQKNGSFFPRRSELCWDANWKSVEMPAPLKPALSRSKSETWHQISFNETHLAAWIVYHYTCWILQYGLRPFHHSPLPEKQPGCWALT